MTSSIHYFTGTGNSLHVAREIAAGLGDATLHSISGRQEASTGPADDALPELDVLGIVSPVYFQGLPAPVRDHIRLVARSKAKYVFFVATHAGGPGRAMADAARLFRKSGARLDYARGIRMPDNYCALVNLVQPLEGQEQRLRDAIPYLKTIVQEIASRASASPVKGSLFSFPEGAVSSLADSMYRAPRRFYATAACASCGTCTRVCPTAAVSLRDGKPVWDSQCVRCMACLHLCPRGAIESGRASVGAPRYRHPAVSVEDIMESRR